VLDLRQHLALYEEKATHTSEEALAKNRNWCPKRRKTGSDTRRVGYRGREPKLLGNSHRKKCWDERSLIIARTMRRIARQSASYTEPYEHRDLIDTHVSLPEAKPTPTEHLKIIARFGSVLFAGQVAIAGRFTVR